MRIVRETLVRPTTADTDIQDLTQDVAQILAQSGIREGQVLVFTPGSTAGITTIEFENGVVFDLEQAIERLAPQDLHYDHNARWGDGNGYSHVRAALLGPSMTVPVIDGQLQLGTWQQVVLCDFDNRPRERRIIVQVMGE